jgi:EmrB/QacA subfamily drug resistance transporter
LPRDRPQPSERLDWRGFLLLSPGLAAAVYGLATSERSGGFTDPRALVPIVLGVALVTAFVLYARRARNARIDVRLFLNRSFAAGAGTTFCTGMALFGALFVLPLYYQGARGQSPLEAGLLIAPQGIGAAMMMPVAGWLTDRIGPRHVVVAGLVVVVAGTLPFAFADGSTPYPLLALTLVVRGIGLGASTMPSMAGAYATLEPDALARASSVLNVMKRVGGSVGVALLAVVLERHLPGAVGSASERAAPASVVADSFRTTFWWVMAFCVVALVPAVFLPRRPAVARERAPAVKRPASAPAG